MHFLLLLDSLWCRKFYKYIEAKQKNQPKNEQYKAKNEENSRSAAHFWLDRILRPFLSSFALLLHIVRSEVPRRQMFPCKLSEQKIFFKCSRNYFSRKPKMSLHTNPIQSEPFEFIVSMKLNYRDELSISNTFLSGFVLMLSALMHCDVFIPFLPFLIKRHKYDKEKSL